LLSEHVNLFLYTLIHENAAFRSYVLREHRHDLDYLLMPQLEILYREVDISKHHVYMIINTWILFTQNQGFDVAVKSIRIKEVPFFKEAPLKDLALTHVMQIVLLRTLQLNLRTKLKEPHIFNNVSRQRWLVCSVLFEPLGGALRDCMFCLAHLCSASWLFVPSCNSVPGEFLQPDHHGPDRPSRADALEHPFKYSRCQSSFGRSFLFHESDESWCIGHGRIVERAAHPPSTGVLPSDARAVHLVTQVPRAAIASRSSSGRAQRTRGSSGVLGS
jgi:hypothetical protein